jgi:hypothetical protein
LAFGPFHRSAHFRLSFTPTETSPLHLAFWPGTSAPTSGFHWHCRPSGRAAVPCNADCHPPPHTKSQTEAPSCHLHFPHLIGVVPSPLPLLTPSKSTRSKTPPPSAASPPPHRLPGPIKCTTASASPHHTRCSPPSLFSVFPVARHRAPPPPSPPLHRRPHPAIDPVTNARGKDR